LTRIHTLANGVRVLCDPVPGCETFALSVVAGRGARAEPLERSGWSHMLEHMVFKGAAGRSARDIVEAIEAEGGSINAQTGYERTSFQVRGLAATLPLAIATSGDLVLRPMLDAAELAKEKQVIAQEIAEATDTPDDHVFEVAQAAAWGDHPVGRPVLGSVASLEPADPAGLHAWRAALYAPDRLIVSAAGAVDEDQVLKLAEAAFGDAAGQGAPDAPAPVFQGALEADTRRLEQAHIVLLLPGVGANDETAFAFRLMAEALGGGMSSRLFQEARETLGLAYAIDGYADTLSDAGALGVYAGCDTSNARRLVEVVAAELKKLTDGIPKAELDRCKALHKASLFFARESMMARAEQPAAQLLTFGRVLESAEVVERIDAVTTEATAAAAAAVLAPRKAAVSIVGPRRAAGAAQAFVDALY
jgi:predicted Zn-dependent peptidase